MIVGGNIRAKLLASCNRHSQFLLAVCLSVNYLESHIWCQMVFGCPVFSSSVFGFASTPLHLATIHQTLVADERQGDELAAIQFSAVIAT